MPPGAVQRTILGPYRVVDFLGAGGMGEVYRAVHTATGRVAAVKVLTAARTPQMVERFRNEGRIQAGLQHPHIVTLFDLFEVDGLPCLAMEYVAGESLERVVQRGAVPVAQALAWFAQVADAVAYVHECGVIHRDLKTSNIRLDEQGRVRLLDFGIAKSGDSPKLTTDGSVVGTLYALSPEQVRGEPATPASDVWALGVLLYEMVTGRAPFAADSLTGVMAKILKGAYEPPSQVDRSLPTAVTRLIAQCLEVSADRRPTAAEARDRARAFASGPREAPPTPGLARWRPRLPLIAAMTAAVLAVAVLVRTIGARDDMPDDPAVDTGQGLVNIPSPPPAANAAVRPVVIQVFGETPAEVFRDGVSVGRTPVRFDAPIGSWVTVTIRRAGYEPLERRFQVHDGINEYTETLRELPVVPPPAGS